MASEHTTTAETLVTRLGMWEAMRSVTPLVVAMLASVLLLEILTPSARRLVPAAPVNAIHFFAVAIGLLLCLVGHYSAETWDRVLFPAWYGAKGRWLASRHPPLGIFPPGEELKRARDSAAHALPRKAGAEGDTDREAV